MMNSTEREAAIVRMQDASSRFYVDAVQIGNHPWIEFCGLMNEYIKVCCNAHKAGIDFTECNVHSGQSLPMKSFQVEYVNEKLSRIFTGRSALK